MSTTPSQVLRSGGVLGLFAVVAAGVLAGTHALTAERIRASEQQRLLNQLQEVLPGGAYDNDVASDVIKVQAPDLRASEPVTVYRARSHGAPVAAILTVTAPDGYGGPIELLVGIGVDGHLTGVRASSHKETPGLGDRVDARRSDWVLGFVGRSLADPTARGWAVRKDGGVFDQFVGATITPRAVVRAVRRSLEFFAQNGEALFASPGQSARSDTPEIP